MASRCRLGAFQYVASGFPACHRCASTPVFSFQGSDEGRLSSLRFSYASTVPHRKKHLADTGSESQQKFTLHYYVKKQGGGDELIPIKFFKFFLRPLQAVPYGPLMDRLFMGNLTDGQPVKEMEDEPSPLNLRQIPAGQ